MGTMLTGGSSTIATAHTQMRKAGATAREMLVAAAAKAWGIPANRIVAANSMLTAPGRSATSCMDSFITLSSSASSSYCCEERRKRSCNVSARKRRK